MKFVTLINWSVYLLLCQAMAANATLEQSYKTTLLRELLSITSTGLNASTSGGWITSGDYRGWGGTIRAGVLLNERHVIEFETNYFQLVNDSTPSTTVAITPLTKEQFVFSIHNVIDEAPLLINYRYQWACNTYPILVYLGAGVGINISSNKTSGSFEEYTVSENVVTPQSVEYFDKNSTRVYPAGQIFAGIGFRLSKNLGLSIGGRMLATERMETTIETQNKNINFGKIASTDTLQTIVEARLLFTW